MTATVTMVIMSARGLVTAGPLCGPLSPHSHLHFHWQLFSPHKKVQHTNLWALLSQEEVWNRLRKRALYKSINCSPFQGRVQVASHLSIRLLAVMHGPHYSKDSACSEPGEEILYVILWKGYPIIIQIWLSGEKMWWRKRDKISL